MRKIFPFLGGKFAIFLPEEEKCILDEEGKLLSFLIPQSLSLQMDPEWKEHTEFVCTLLSTSPMFESAKPRLSRCSGYSGLRLLHKGSCRVINFLYAHLVYGGEMAFHVNLTR